MDSPQSVVSPFKGSSILAEPEKNKSSDQSEVQSKEAGGCNSETAIGVLDVRIHQARDIHNICIYHKQDVYAKLCLTSDPENPVSTKIINGGGKNPVFSENLKLNVRTVESSLKCEVWMLSRVKNYLEDQLLGFSLVPLSEILMNNCKLEEEFSLSSTDLFHSPAGFVHLSISYAGTSPEVISMTATKTAIIKDSEILLESLSGELDKIEFPDPMVVNENERMVSQYFGIPTPECMVSSNPDNPIVSEIGVRLVESFSTGDVVDSPRGSVTTNGSTSERQEFVSPSKDKLEDESNSTEKAAVISNINIVSVPESKVVQQDIVDMYMKSMQQFTESLAKMKLPMDVESNESSDSPGKPNPSADQITPRSNGSKVFYGSRAFF